MFPALSASTEHSGYYIFEVYSEFIKSQTDYKQWEPQRLLNNSFGKVTYLLSCWEFYDYDTENIITHCFKPAQDRMPPPAKQKHLIL